MYLRSGRLEFNPYRRSVQNRIRSAHVETPDPDADCARCHAAVRPVSMPVSIESLGQIAVHSAANELWAAGVRPVEYRPIILLPDNTQEEELRRLIDTLCAVSRCEKITLGHGHIEITDAVQRPVISGSIAGQSITDNIYTNHIVPGAAIVMTKWAGMEASFLIACEREQELAKYFPVTIRRDMKQMCDALSIAVESAAAAKSGARMMLALSEGGIYTALWDLAQKTGTGLSVDLTQIPILQETIELANFYDIDPYKMSSEGSLLLVFETPDADIKAQKYITALAEDGIYASLIGHLTDNRDKIIQNGGDVRYLDRPGPDELLKILK